MKNLLFLLLIFLGITAGALIIPSMQEDGMRYAFAALAIVISAAVIGVVLYYLARLKQSGDSGENLQSLSEVGFVVDTFQDVVGTLKKREDNLENLRNIAEARASSMEAYSEYILQSVPSGVITIGNDMRIESVNRAAAGILSLSQNEIIGQDFSEILGPPFSELAEGNILITRSEYPYQTQDKRQVWLGISTSELKNSYDMKIGLIFVFTDLTDIKTLQAQMELKQRLSQLGEMSAGISHEMRNSMSVILGYAKLLAKRVEDSNKKTVDAIISEIHIVDRVISELLAFAKPSVLQHDKIELNALVEETVASVLLGYEAVRFTFYPEATVTVMADKILLRQAIANLVLNAAEAMPEGGDLVVGLKYKDSKAELHIKDTGCGIAEDICQKIFLPFYTTKPEGIGFGLALVQKIIVSHGGNIDVFSEEGKGTEFILSFIAE
ncbi:MAG: PAS domain S-box protein [Nitrospira sp.]|nr:PAS domain S-box protein [Nitrospira sp.]